MTTMGVPNFGPASFSPGTASFSPGTASFSPGTASFGPGTASRVGVGSERGSGTVLTGIITGCLVGITVIGVWVIGWVTSAHRADRAADLSALAGAHAVAGGRDGCGEARRVATRHGAKVTSCTMRGTAPSFVLLVTTTVPLRPKVVAPGAPTVARGKAAAGPGQR